MIKVASLPLTTNLLDFSRLLSSKGFAHRINEESGEQVLWVGNEADAEIVRNALQQWLERKPDSSVNEGLAAANSGDVSRDARGFINNVFAAVYYYPVTALLFGLCVVVAVVSGLGASPSKVSFLFYPFVASDGLLLLLSELNNPLKAIQTLTPIFLHFGELHLVFNMLWLWYFGRQLESVQSKSSFIAVVLITAFVSNTTQYMLNDANNFGGMSGVVYGLVGYSWMIHKLMPKSYLVLTPNMMTFFVLALVLMEVFASSMVATGAHVGGLLAGLVLGIFVVLINRFVLQTAAVGNPPRRR
ncbi:MAG: rhomboid family intramembrane serine protease [Pseudohongiellaceae bacterium]